MASTFAAVPGSGSFNSQDPDPRHLPPPAFSRRQLSANIKTESVSPSANQVETPADSTTTLSRYQSSDLSDLDEDPFFGADFSSVLGDTPSFLNNPALLKHLESTTTEFQHQVGRDGAPCPLTPTQTASIHATTPQRQERDVITRPNAHQLPHSISPQLLQRPSDGPSPVAVESSHLTPSQSSSNRTSEDGRVPPPIAMNLKSPRVTVSVWDKDHAAPGRTVQGTFEDSLIAAHGGVRLAGDLISSADVPSLTLGHRGSLDDWRNDGATRRGGLDPESRPSDTVPSINQIFTGRNIQARNQEVGKWLSESINDVSAPWEKTVEVIGVVEQSAHDDNDGIPLGHGTENRRVPGQTYFNEDGGGQMNDIDRTIIATNRNWADAPALDRITMGIPGQNQPHSSQAAIDKFESMCRDNDSVISRSATWGTRRRSHPSVLDLDVEGVTSGSFLKKLSIGRGSGDKGNKSGSLLRDLRGLVRRPSASSLRKRSRSRSCSGKGDEAPRQRDEEQQGKHDGTPHLLPTSHMSSWCRKPTPSINTALVSMAHNFASIGTTHSRSGSISGPAPMASPKNSFSRSLSVKNTLRRPRSNSEIPQLSSAAASGGSRSNLVELWTKSGGPPVASLGKTSNVDADDDDDDEDDELYYQDNDMKASPDMIDYISPNLAGFQQHITKLNPGLDATHGYLVDRIAHQQVVRYKHLLNARVKHLGLGANCPCGSLCIALGGSANMLGQKGDAGGMDSLASHSNDLDDATPVEGVISQESFPHDIPIPPTHYLPAEFECQLCYQRKKFQKPSDWTKHVHEDVQPFTCTWEKCREPKIFKRKADWVRHENEGHRHLEWWTCNVGDCRHTCYRRDNFLQHLVREHKFSEPKLKTKAAAKRAGGMDQTWQKVAQCHVETSTRPQEEPCRFCGKVFATWRKLTVHLAKHMEQISLPVLRLVAAMAKELDADTTISPVQDTPPQPMVPLNQTVQCPGVRRQQQQQQEQQLQPGHDRHMGYVDQTHLMYAVMAPGQYQQRQLEPFEKAQCDGTGQNLQPSAFGVGQRNQGYSAYQQQMQGLSGTCNILMQVSNPYVNNNEVEAFPQLVIDSLGLQKIGDAQMGYEALVDPSGAGGSRFSGHEPLSTYVRSPHRYSGSGNEDQWGEKGLAGFP